MSSLWTYIAVEIKMKDLPALVQRRDSGICQHFPWGRITDAEHELLFSPLRNPAGSVVGSFFPLTSLTAFWFLRDTVTG